MIFIYLSTFSELMLFIFLGVRLRGYRTGVSELICYLGKDIFNVVTANLMPSNALACDTSSDVVVNNHKDIPDFSKIQNALSTI